MLAKVFKRSSVPGGLLGNGEQLGVVKVLPTISKSSGPGVPYRDGPLADLDRFLPTAFADAIGFGIHPPYPPAEPPRGAEQGDGFIGCQTDFVDPMVGENGAALSAATTDPPVKTIAHPEPSQDGKTRSDGWQGKRRGKKRHISFIRQLNLWPVLRTLAVFARRPSELNEFRQVKTHFALDNLAQGNVRRVEAPDISQERAVGTAAAKIQLAHAP